jgi:hypothetical protein
MDERKFHHEWQNLHRDRRTEDTFLVCYNALMDRNFTWIPFYQELADELARWENRQDELISFLEELRTQGFVITHCI